MIRWETASYSEIQTLLKTTGLSMREIARRLQVAPYNFTTTLKRRCGKVCPREIQSADVKHILESTDQLIRYLRRSHKQRQAKIEHILHDLSKNINGNHHHWRPLVEKQAGREVEPPAG